MATSMDEWLGSSTESRLDAVLDMTCRLVGHDEIGSVHVVLPERPSYTALLRYRARAEACGFSLTLMDLAVTVRPRAGGEPDAAVPDGTLLSWAVLTNRGLRAGSTVLRIATGGVSGSVRWLRQHLEAWGAELRGMNEGTR